NRIYFDSTTIYFESFDKDGIRQSGFSKDGKFKEDQIVLAMACYNTGIPFHMKVFPGNTADCNTLIDFIKEVRDIYGIKTLYVIADRGMWTNKNIEFLVQNNYYYLISNRAKVGSKKFKTYIAERSDFIKINDDFLIKEQIVTPEIQRNRSHVFRRVITYNKERADKDKYDREILINNFIKLQNKDGFINEKRIIGSKGGRYYDAVSKSLYRLNTEKVKEDELLDGIYVYETNIMDLDALEICRVYAEQWKIEENFRSLKSVIQIRPVYLSLDEHIIGHSVICFISLVIMKLLHYMLIKIIKITFAEMTKVLTELTSLVYIDTKSRKIIWEKRNREVSDFNLWKTYDMLEKITSNF
ncbi:IS1634 family transposase, partial [Mycoplasma sp. 5912]